LNQYYDKAVRDESFEWIFVVSTPQLMETSNVKIINYPWVKASWIHRLFFDYFVAPKLVRKYSPDELLSLQNVVVPHVNVPQTLYFHNILPFADKKYRLFENSLFWIYQNVISKIILSSFGKAINIVVQAQWIKQKFVNLGVCDSKIVVEHPVIEEIIAGFYSQQNAPIIFIYPAVALEYKNHEVIIRATILLKKKGLNDYTIVFTINENDNKLSRKLYQTVKKHSLNIEFVGVLSKDDLFSYYTKSILLFPSFVETFGLPMLEARLHNAPVIASDCAFSHEILDGYNKADFFAFDDVKKLSNLIKKYL
jgi:Glycosyltransferase